MYYDRPLVYVMNTTFTYKGMHLMFCMSGESGGYVYPISTESEQALADHQNIEENIPRPDPNLPIWLVANENHKVWTLQEMSYADYERLEADAVDTKSLDLSA